MFSSNDKVWLIIDILETEPTAIFKTCLPEKFNNNWTVYEWNFILGLIHDDEQLK